MLDPNIPAAVSRAEPLAVLLLLSRKQQQSVILSGVSLMSAHVLPSFPVQLLPPSAAVSGNIFLVSFFY